MNIPSSFPKSLSYSIKQMAGNMSRIGVKLTPDRVSGIKENDVITLKLPNSSIVDLRTFNLFYQFSTTGTSGIFLHPRYSSSLIERISIIINSQTIDITPSYNMLYNTLMDLEGSSFDQFSKRNVCEFFDPSLKFTVTDPSSSSTADIAITGANWTAATTTSAPVKIDGAITHWLSFIGSCNPSCIDTSDAGDVYLQIQFSNSYILPAVINTTTTYSGASFTLDNVFASVDVISFSSDEYYDLKASKLAASGLNIGFYSYLNSRFAAVAKSSGVSVNWNVSANSLDQIICTLQKKDATSTLKPMIAYGSNDTGGTVYNMSQIISDPITKTNNTGSTRSDVLGDAFMNSYYFIRAAQGLKESRISINNRSLNYGYLSPKEIFVQTLTALGYNHIDLGTNGLNVGILSLQHFLKYYFAHIIDLTIQDSQDFYISGLNSLGSTLTITWDANFVTNYAQEVVPIMYARLTKILRIERGRNITVI